MNEQEREKMVCIHSLKMHLFTDELSTCHACYWGTMLSKMDQLPALMGTFWCEKQTLNT